MKIHRLANFTVVALSLGAFVNVGCAEKDKTAADRAAIAASPASAQPAAPGAPSAMIAPAAANPDAMAVRWSEVKGATYDMRPQFFVGAELLQATVDRQISELNAHRSTMKSTVVTKDWDFAMKEMNDSRAHLQAMITEARSATADTWDQAKDKVSRAWDRTQAAYDRVKASTTT